MTNPNDPKPDQGGNDLPIPNIDTQNQSTVDKIISLITNNPTASLLGAFVLAAVSISTGVYKIFIEPKEEIIKNLNREKTELSTDFSRLNEQANTQKEILESYKTKFKDIILVSPPNDGIVIGTHIPIRWSYHDPGPGNYVLDVYRFPNFEQRKVPLNAALPQKDAPSKTLAPLLNHPSPTPVVPEYISFVNPEGPYTYMSPKIFGNEVRFGKFFWRICKGRLRYENPRVDGPCSEYRKVEVYPSIMDRIKQKNQLIVGVNPTFRGKFVGFNMDGFHEGMEVDISCWLGKKIKKAYELEKIEVIFLDFAWLDLLEAVTSHKVDMALSLITRTKEREKQYLGLKFSNSYFDLKEQFIMSTEAELPNPVEPSQLKNWRVGVPAGTISQYVATDLKARYSFTVLSHYPLIEDVYQGLRSNQIQLGLIDAVAIPQGFKPAKLSKELQADLEETIRNHLGGGKGFESEGYGIAVINEAPLPNKGSHLPLIKIINKALNEQSVKGYLLPALMKRWGITEEVPQKGASALTPEEHKQLETLYNEKEYIDRDSACGVVWQEGSKWLQEL